jgi:hypothetical protein
MDVDKHYIHIPRFAKRATERDRMTNATVGPLHEFGPVVNHEVPAVAGELKEVRREAKSLERTEETLRRDLSSSARTEASLRAEL